MKLSFRNKVLPNIKIQYNPLNCPKQGCPGLNWVVGAAFCSQIIPTDDKVKNSIPGTAGAM